MVATMGILGAAAAITFVVREAGSASTTAELNGSPPTRTVIATAGPRTSSPAATPVTVSVPGAETVVSIAPSPPAIPAPGATPDAAQVPPDDSMRQIIYTIAGNQRPDDPITIVYADETGALRTEENVVLPWTKVVIPSRDAPVNYITASSYGSQLNCWISDVNGVTLVSQVDNAITATCNR
jgi:hypothetical protein